MYQLMQTEYRDPYKNIADEYIPNLRVSRNSQTTRHLWKKRGRRPCSDMVRVMCAPWRIGGEPPLPRSSPRYPAELSQFQDGLLHEAFRKLFRSHTAGGTVPRNSFINLA